MRRVTGMTIAMIAGQHAANVQHNRYRSSAEDAQPLMGFGSGGLTGIRKMRAAVTKLLPNLTASEEDFVQLVNDGNVEGVKEYLQRFPDFNLNCQNYCGYAPLTVATMNGDYAMVQCLLKYSHYQLGDAVLHAIKMDKIRIVKILLDKLKKESHHLLADNELTLGPSPESPDFTEDITPLKLAAFCGNYEMIELLLARGHEIEKPHMPDCFCEEQCSERRLGEKLRTSVNRYNAYRALVCPAYICQTSEDPILTAFILSQELLDCASVENEFKVEYYTLSETVSQFAVDLLAQCRTTEEVEGVLDHSGGAKVSRSLKRFARCAHAIECEQKEFIAHPNCQQVLRSAWLEGWQDWKGLSVWSRTARILPRMVLLPLIAIVYWIAPQSKVAAKWTNPINKYFSFCASYGIFLMMLLTQVSLDNNVSFHGPPSTGCEIWIIFYVTGLGWAVIKDLYNQRQLFFRNTWNVYDLVMVLMFYSLFLCWLLSTLHYQMYGDGDLPRYKWSQFDPMLIGEIFHAYAVMAAFFKLQFFFQMNDELGALQVSVFWMLSDIFRFLIMFMTIMLSFAMGLHMLYHHYTDWTGLMDGQEGRQKSCFSTFIESVKTLYWAIYGYSPPEYANIVTSQYFERTQNQTILIENHHGVTEVMGHFIFASYYIFGVIIMFNMLIAMMSTSFSTVEANSDTEYKYVRTMVWLDFFEEGNTLPPPFNMIPTPKSIWRVITWCGKKCSRRTIEKVKEPEVDGEIYRSLMATLVQRYLTKRGRRGPVTIVGPKAKRKKSSLANLVNTSSNTANEPS